MRRNGFLAAACWFAVALAAGACGSATRAQLHEDDVKKVFPWPRDAREVSVRVKPLTTMANACVWLGSYEQVTVGPDTTFYITDELDKSFAYTPGRSPIRRLAPVQTIEIRWPLQQPADEAAPAGAQEDEAGKNGAEGDSQTEQPAPSDGRNGEQKPPPPKGEQAG